MYLKRDRTGITFTAQFIVFIVRVCSPIEISIVVFMHALYNPLGPPKVSQSVIFIFPEVHMVSGGCEAHWQQLMARTKSEEKNGKGKLLFSQTVLSSRFPSLTNHTFNSDILFLIVGRDKITQKVTQGELVQTTRYILGQSQHQERKSPWVLTLTEQVPEVKSKLINMYITLAWHKEKI